MSNFIQFPSRVEILGQLAGVEGAPPWRSGFCEALAERLDSRVYDSAAFTFVITEVLYEHADERSEQGPSMLAEVILALTCDRQLAITALQTLDEIERLISAPGHRETGAANARTAKTPIGTAKDARIVA